MPTTTPVTEHDGRDARGALRARLLAGLPVAERNEELAGVRTAWLEGGEGPPLLLLHGPGESAVNWRWVIPDLARDHRVVAPDLPAHGSSGGIDEHRAEEPATRWLGALIERSCPEPPVLIGHVLGGALGARYAVRHAERLRGLVLVDSLGLAAFRPTLRFLAGLIGFQAHPTATTFRWFLGQCAYDLEALRLRMREEWDAFEAYNLALATSPNAGAAGRMLRRLGLPRIPKEALEQIRVPTTLIWGRHDRANRLSVAADASVRYGWPLHVIEDAADDPARDQPGRFLEALRSALANPALHPAAHP